MGSEMCIRDSLSTGWGAAERVEVGVEAFLGQGDVRGVPLLPGPGLVPGHQQDCLPAGVEGEEDPDLAAPARAGVQLLKVLVPGAG